MDRIKRVLVWLGRRAWDIAFVVLALGLLVWIADDAFGARVVTLSQGADYWEHSAALRELIDHPFSPRNPHLNSLEPSPRFVPLFILCALAARALHLDALDAMGVVATANVLLLVVGIFLFFRSYFRDARASLIGFIVAFGSWYDAWHFSNVYQLKILFSTAPYPSTTALGLSLLGFTLTLRVLRKGPGRFGLALLTACWTSVAITHPLTALLGFSGGVLLALTEPSVPLRLRLKVAATVPLGLAISFLWPYFSMRRVLVGGSHDQVEAISRTLAGGAEESAGRLHQFYRREGLVHTLGAALVGIPVSLYLLIRRQHLFIPLGAAAMVLPFVVNAYLPLPLGHRFILLAVFYLQVGLVYFFMKLLPSAPEAFGFVNHRWVRWPVSILILGCLAVFAKGNIDAAIGRLDYSTRRMRGAELSVNVRYGQRVAELAGPNAVILADAQTSWPVPTFGPKVLVIFHNNPLVSDDGERIIHVVHFLNPNTNEADRRESIAKYGVTHLLLKRNQLGRLGGFLDLTESRVALPGGYWLFTLGPSLRGPGPGSGA